MTLPDWDLPLLQELIDARGDKVIHEIAVTCSTCRNGDAFASFVNVDGRPGNIRSLACPNCHGDGFVYRDPKILQGLVTSLTSGNRQLQDIGYARPGDAVFSPSMLVRSISDMDRITMTVATSIDNQVILRGAATMQENAMLETDLETNEDRLWYLPESVIWCEDANGVIYYHGVDFTFDGKKVVWSGNTPETGTLYSIKYRGYTEWVSYASPMERYDQGRDLAARVLLKKKHVYFLNGNQADTAVDRATEASAFTKSVLI